MSNALRRLGGTLWGAFGRIPIKRRLMLTFSVLLVLPIAISYTVLIRDASSIIREQALASARQVVRNGETRLSARLLDAVRAAEVARDSPELQSALRRLARGEAYPLDQQIADYRQMDKQFATLESTYGLHRLRVYLPDAPLFGNERVHFFPFGEIAGQPWFRAMDISHALVQPERFPYIFDRAQNIVSTNLALIDPDDFERAAGMVAADIELCELANMLDTALQGGRSVALLVDAQGNIAARAGDAALLAGVSPHALGAGALQPVLASGSIGYAASIGNTGLSLWSLVDERALMAPVRALERQMLWILGITTALAFVLTLLSTSLSVDRLRSLARDMKRVMAGDLSVRVAESAPGEIGMLEKTFNYLIASFERSMRQTMREQQERQNAEIRLLQAQIKPHFLYNTLDHLRWRALETGDARSAELIEVLARFYRLGLARGHESVRLEDEFQHALLYLRIQNRLHDDFVRVESSLPEALRGVSVPGLILQPLVENAVVHGILETEGQSGRVSLAAAMEGDVLTLRVADDGVGMPPDTRAHILESSRERHFGVWNVHHRLRLRYGEGSGLSYIDNQPGTIAIVTIDLSA